MGQSPVVRYAIIPALITIPLVGLRAWLEVNHPGETITKLVSLNVLALLWIIFVAVSMRRSGAGLRAYFAVLATFCVLYRLVISGVYTLAWAQTWTTKDGALTRYQRDMIEAFTKMKLEAPEQASAFVVFAFTAFFPILMHLVVGVIIWFITRLFVRPPAQA